MANFTKDIIADPKLTVSNIVEDAGVQKEIIKSDVMGIKYVGTALNHITIAGGKTVSGVGLLTKATVR